MTTAARRILRSALPLTLAACLALPLTAAAGTTDDPAGPALLTEPFLQAPGHREVSVVWFTDEPGTSHVVLTGEVAELTDVQVEALLETGRANAGSSGNGNGNGRRLAVAVHPAVTTQLSRTAEDYQSVLPDRPAPEDGIVARPVSRHEARVSGLHPRQDMAYRVVSVLDGQRVLSDTYRLADAPMPDEDLTILLTSDHQQKNNTPANMQWAAEVLDDIDAVFFAGDLVNVPDRASEWFDAANGLALFPGIQGTAEFTAPNGVTYAGGQIAQNAPVYPAIGNHEVQGRIDGKATLGASFNGPVPTAVAEAEYEKVAAEVNPTGDPAVRARWIEDNSFSTTTYEEIFTLPQGSPGGERYYAATVGNVRLISLFSTRIWRGTTATPDPAARTSISRYQESASVLDQPLEQGHGEFLFESLAVDSAQYDWLQQELTSRETRRADHVVVMLHEGPQGLGDNVMPHFAEPVRTEELDEDGKVVGIRYEYPASGNVLLTDLTPLIDREGTPVDLVFNGHSHLWNRFASEHGVNYLETSNVGNTYGAFHELSGRSRPVPPPPWDASNYLAVGNPGGLAPIVPSENPFLTNGGVPEPYVQSDRYTVFSALDSGAGTVTSWVLDTQDPEQAPRVLDVFDLDD